MFTIPIGQNYCRSKVLQNALLEHSAVLWTCFELPPAFKTFVLPNFEWPLETRDRFHSVFIFRVVLVTVIGNSVVQRGQNGTNYNHFISCNYRFFHAKFEQDLITYLSKAIE